MVFAASAPDTIIRTGSNMASRNSCGKLSHSSEQSFRNTNDFRHLERNKIMAALQIQFPRFRSYGKLVPRATIRRFRMALQSHLAELERRHQALEKQIEH